MKAFNKVIDKIRNEELRRTKQGDKINFKGSTHLFLKMWRKLKRPQRVRLKDILVMNKRFNTVNWLKEFLNHLWENHIPGSAEGALAEWCSPARQDGHPDLVRFAKTLERYATGIVNYCRHRMHTSKLEGVNNKIKVIKRIAYGFHDLEYFALKVKQALPGRYCSN